MNTRAANLIAAGLIFLWTYTAGSKWMDYPAFRSVLAQSPLIDKGAGTLAFLLPLTELGTALLLLFPRSRPAGFLASFILLVLFTSYLGYMVLYAPHLPCSCGDVISTLSWKEHIAFNLFFLLLTTGALFLQGKNPSTTAPPGPS